MLEQLLHRYGQWVAAAEQVLPADAAHAAIGLALFVLLLWVLESIDTMTGHRLDRLGIRPRSFSGLTGVLFAPLLHGGFGHLAANSLPLLVLGTLVAFTDLENLAVVTIVVWVLSGLGVWLFGRSNTCHLGASGLVFGYMGFLLTLAALRQSPGAIVLAVVALLLYGGAIWGILPLRRGRSWQGHLFGLLAGALCAWQLLPLREYLG